MTTTNDNEATLTRLMSRATFTVSIEPDDTPPEDCFASGDDDFDRETCAEIRADLESGNPWAWCVVTVTASVDGSRLRGAACLGGCSYESEEGFRTPGGHFDDMKSEAASDLLEQLSAASAALAALGA